MPSYGQPLLGGAAALGRGSVFVETLKRHKAEHPHHWGLVENIHRLRLQDGSVSVLRLSNCNDMIDIASEYTVCFDADGSTGQSVVSQCAASLPDKAVAWHAISI
jgi:hypothetical protein